MKSWDVDPAVIDRITGAVIGFLVVEHIIVRPEYDGIQSRLDKSIKSVKEEYSLESLYKDDRVQGMRRLYRNLGIDPARYRPSSERLLRRILRGKELSRLHPIVDACNLVSIQTRMPLGLYDLKKLEGNITLRFGVKGESYLGHTGLETGAERKFIVADERGPVGSPTTDSRRTKVDDTTDSVLLIAYGPPGLTSLPVDEALDIFALITKEAVGGQETAREIKMIGSAHG